METRKKIIFQYSLPAILTLLVVGIVLGIKQIFPFGSNTIDYYDMGQQIAAFYYHVYDALHGEKSLFFDWYSALGTNMVMNTSGSIGISVFSLLLYLFPRDMILQALSVFTLVKMMCMSVAMYYFLRKRIKSDYFWMLCFSVGYGLSGYVLMQYTINQWLDIAVLLPLLMEGVCRLLKEKKAGMYIALLSLCLLESYYQSFLILMFVILAVGLYLLLLSEKEIIDKRRAVYLLAFATFLTIGVSAFVLIPQWIQTFQSTRFSNGAGEGNFYLNILKQVKGAYMTRWWVLFGLSLPFAVIIRGIIRNFRMRDRKRLIFSLGILFVVCAELFVESINLLLHFGSYVGYPIRNGFILCFVVLTTACYYSKDFPTFMENVKSRRNVLLYLFGILFVIVASGVFILFYWKNPGMTSRQVLHITFLICVITFLIYSLLLYKNWSRYAIFVLLAELLMFSYIQLGKPTYVTGYLEEAEQTGAYIATSNELKECLEIKSSVTERIKNPDTQLNSNYPFIMQRAALSNWTHMISPEVQQGAAEWGYTKQFTRVLDSGGTVFSDALLGVTETLSMVEQPEELYIPLGTETVKQDGESYEYTLYENRYKMPFGIVVPSLKLEKAQGNATPFDLQNEVFHLLEPEKENDLIEIAAVGEGAEDGHQEIQVNGEHALYFAGYRWDNDSGNMNISVNGKMVEVPTIREPHNTGYPAYFNNNMLFLGVFQDEMVTIDVDYTKDSDAGEENEGEKFAIGALDLFALRELCDDYTTRDSVKDVLVGKSSISLTVDAMPGQNYLLLPFGWDSGFAVTCNGTVVDSTRTFGLFTAMPIEEGENQIKITFFPTGMKIGVIISMISLFLINATRMISLRKTNQEPDGNHVLERVIYIVFWGVWCIMVLAIYMIPILYIPITIFL